MNRATRRLGFIAALSIATLAWVLVFAWPGGRAAWSPETIRALPLDDFTSQTAQLGVGESGLSVRSPGPGRLVDLHLDLEDVAADEFRYFSYVIDGVPATRKLVLVWQGSEGRGFAILPDGIGHGGTLDLARVAAWRGRIDRIGLALVPVDYVPPEALSAPELRIDELTLSSVSVGRGVAALWSEWTAARAWTGRSTNTGGFDFVGSAGPSLPAFVVGLAVIAALLVRVFLGRVAVSRVAMRLLVAAALVLVAEQIRQHVSRATTVIAAHRALPENDAAVLSGHPPLAADARLLLRRLQQEDASVRIRVYGTTGFISEYALWLLREQDAGGLLAPHELAAQAVLSGSLLVLVGEGDWAFDADASRLRVGAEMREATPYFDGAVMKAYRFPPSPENSP